MDPSRDKENFIPSLLKPKTALPLNSEHSRVPHFARKFGKELLIKPSVTSSQSTQDVAAIPCSSSIVDPKTGANKPSVFPNKFDIGNKASKSSCIPNSFIEDGKDDDLPKSPELSSEFSLSYKLKEEARYQSLTKTKVDSGFHSALKASGTKYFDKIESTPSYHDKMFTNLDTGTYLYDGRNTTVPGSVNKCFEQPSNQLGSEIKRNLRHCQSTPDCKQGNESQHSSAFSSHTNNILSRIQEFKKPVAAPRRPIFIHGSTMKLELDLDESIEDDNDKSSMEDDEQDESARECQNESSMTKLEDLSTTDSSLTDQRNTVLDNVNKPVNEHPGKERHHLNHSNSNKHQNQMATPNLAMKIICVKQNNENKREIGVGSPHTETKSQSVQTEPTEKAIVVNNIFYTVMSQIGQGGSSKVFEARCNKNGKMVAIKQVYLAKADKYIRESYANEINLLKKLSGSDRVIKLYDFEYHDQNGILNVVMEKGELDLQTLIKNIAASGKLKDYELQYYWMQMLEAVQVVHEAGIIHSDLKPANFVIAKGRLKLIDFGIASSIQSDDVTSVMKDTIIGTYNFMSPEAIQEIKSGDDSMLNEPKRPCIKISRRSDVWSLGCILYGLTYGKTPFEHIRAVFSKMSAITNPNHPINYPPSNENVISIIKQCLIRDPKKRLSIEELLKNSFFLTKNG